MFIAGWFSGVCWFVGAFLPLFRNPKFLNKVSRDMWICNIVASLIYVILVIVLPTVLL